MERNQLCLDPEATVKQYVTPSGVWDILKWKCFLPDWLVDQIKKVNPPRQIGNDLLWWRESSDGNFNVRSAYAFCSKKNHRTVEPYWQGIWR